MPQKILAPLDGYAMAELLGPDIAHKMGAGVGVSIGMASHSTTWLCRTAVIGLIEQKSAWAMKQ